MDIVTDRKEVYGGLKVMVDKGLKWFIFETHFELIFRIV